MVTPSFGAIWTWGHMSICLTAPPVGFQVATMWGCKTESLAAVSCGIGRVAEHPWSDNSGEMPLRLEKQPTLFSCVKWFCSRRSLIMCKRVEFSFCYCHFQMYPLLVLSHLLSRGMHCHGVRAPHTAVRFLFWTHSFTLLLFFSHQSFALEIHLFKFYTSQTVSALEIRTKERVVNITNGNGMLPLLL